MKTLTFSRFERGQGAPEYGLVIALVALVSVVMLGVLGLAATRQYGLLGGALGVRKDIQTPKNFIYFDNDKPQCGSAGVARGLYAQFFSDIDQQYLTVSTDFASVVPTISVNDTIPPGATGIGNYILEFPITHDTPCPTALTIQSNK